MPNTSLENTKVLFEGLKEVSLDRMKYNERNSMIDKIYRTVPSSKAVEEFFSQSQVPDITEFTGRFSEVKVTPGYSTKIELAQFGAFLETQRTLMDDDQYSVFTLSELEAGLMDSADRVREDKAVAPINNATSSAFDFISNQEEGVALASNSHTTKVVGVSTASGFDNLGTSALTKTSMAATKILIKKFKTPIGKKWSQSRRWGLLVPTSLEHKALEINNTPWGLDSGQRNENTHAGSLEIIVWDRMEDASTTNWAMVDLDLMKRNMVFLDRVKKETERERDFMTKAIRQSIYDRYALGHVDWRHIFFHST